MGLYEAAKDALKVAQSVDNIELVQKLLDVQKMALDMQEKQQELQGEIGDLKKENEELRATKKFTFANGHNWLIDPDNPSRHLCPFCTKKHSAPIPLDGTYCRICKGIFN